MENMYPFNQNHENKMEALVETQESLCDASDLSFVDDSRDDILDAPNAGHIEKRRSSKYELLCQKKFGAQDL